MSLNIPKMATVGAGLFFAYTLGTTINQPKVDHGSNPGTSLAQSASTVDGPPLGINQGEIRDQAKMILATGQASGEPAPSLTQGETTVSGSKKELLPAIHPAEIRRQAKGVLQAEQYKYCNRSDDCASEISDHVRKLLMSISILNPKNTYESGMGYYGAILANPADLEQRFAKFKNSPAYEIVRSIAQQPDYQKKLLNIRSLFEVIQDANRGPRLIALYRLVHRFENYNEVLAVDNALRNRQLILPDNEYVLARRMFNEQHNNFHSPVNSYSSEEINSEQDQAMFDAHRQAMRKMSNTLIDQLKKSSNPDSQLYLTLLTDRHVMAAIELVLSAMHHNAGSARTSYPTHQGYITKEFGTWDSAKASEIASSVIHMINEILPANQRKK